MTELTLNSLVGCVGPYNLSLAHFKALHDPAYVADVVIDAYMYIICKNFEDCVHVCTQSMTKILSGSQRAKSHYFCKKNIFQTHKKIIGAHLENGNHWTLFFCDLKTQAVIYMDPLGEKEEQKTQILQNWSSFAKAKGCDYKWTWTDVAHPRQEDGHSCGVHVLMFAQAILDGKKLVEGYDSADIPRLRAQLCQTLFTSSDRAIRCTVCWGLLRKDKVCCSQCGAVSHLKCLPTSCEICVLCSREEVLFLTKQKSECPKDGTGQALADENNQGEEKGDEKDTSNYKKRKASDDWDAGHKSEVLASCSSETPNEDISIPVFGRLALTGQRKAYLVSEDEIQRRIQGENMSSNVFRDLLGV